MTHREIFNTTPQVKKNRLNLLPENPEVNDAEKVVGPGRFPSWLHRKMPRGRNLRATGAVMEQNRLHTVCEEARCPNLLECWSKKTATFLVLGKECTRSCGFCSIDFSKAPKSPEPDEPSRVAASVKALDLRHAVITMVARDDLPDGGAEQMSRIIAAIKKEVPGTTVEVLTSDFEGKAQALDTVVAAAPEIFNHNIETVRELTPRVRHKATYDRTLSVLRYIAETRKGHEPLLKSGLMVGLGETPEQVERCIDDLRTVGCDIITIGQYLQSDRKKLIVKEFVTPEQFRYYEQYGHAAGVKHMFCGPFIRSSYNAAEVFQRAKAFY